MACNGCSSGCSECTPMVINPVYSHTKPRSLVIFPGDTAKLTILFRGADGEPEDVDNFPSVTVINPTGTVVSGPTTQGVYRTNTGEYSFNYLMSINPNIGVWRDIWEGTIDGFKVRGEGTFQVNTTQLPAVNTDGNQHLGDDPGFCYSQLAICNINKLLKALRRRLKSSGVRPGCDEHGNTVFETCDIFSVDELVTFIATSLTMFNEVPHFTMFTFEDSEIVNLFFDVIVQGALYQALAAQALIERGREFSINDTGTSFTPPTVSEILSSQYQKEMDNWYDKIKMIKASMPPSPIFLGTLRPMAASPQFRRLRHLRARQIY